MDATMAGPVAAVDATMVVLLGADAPSRDTAGAFIIARSSTNETFSEVSARLLAFSK